jgi:hypothetical protein
LFPLHSAVAAASAAAAADPGVAATPAAPLLVRFGLVEWADVVAPGGRWRGGKRRRCWYRADDGWLVAGGIQP